MQVALTMQTPPSPISQNSSAKAAAAWKWCLPEHAGATWETRKLTDEKGNYCVDEGKTEQEPIATVAPSAGSWHRSATHHQHATSQRRYTVLRDAKELELMTTNDAFSADGPPHGHRLLGGEAYERSYVNHKSCIFQGGGVNGEEPDVLSRNRTAEPSIIPANPCHPHSIHDGPSPTLPAPIPASSLHITSLQSPPASPNSSASYVKGAFEPTTTVNRGSPNLAESPQTSTISPNFLKRRRASTTAMYDYQHNTNANYNDDDGMKRPKSTSTAICHPKKRKMSASFINSIALYPVYPPRATSTCSFSSEASAAFNDSSSVSSSPEDSCKPRPERRHRCNLCAASFARGHDLRRHERTHSNVRDHKCSVCGREFSRRDALQRHTGVCEGQRKGGKKISKMQQ